ncbi:MAG TPA: 3-carboxymuconate cyclase, partial [Burkholderiales bacterium]|nr:3-carboxymuconate cyclase [Burkholderiales bacterium]
MIDTAIRRMIAGVAIAAAALLASCGPKSEVNVSGAGGPPGPGDVSIGGTVSGLAGMVVLQNNGGESLSIPASGSFTFLTPVASGAQYNIAVLTQPAGQICTVANGAGIASGASITSVKVTCAMNTFSVGGAVSGLSGTVVLQVNGGNNLSLSASGPFTFNTPLADRSGYSVTVLTPPAGQSCSIARGTGTLAGANVTNVSVSCAANTFTVGGTVSGLNGTLVLQNNGKNNLSVAVNGPFVFSAALPGA